MLVIETAEGIRTKIGALRSFDEGEDVFHTFLTKDGCVLLL
jgi:hypothetical protein